jgi:hypothetical protein
MRGWLVMTAGPRCSSTKTPWPAAAASSATTTPDTIGSGAFDLILRGLDIGGEPPWMAAIREANKRRQQEARELNADEPG